ncbi:MAG TPA: hypothetical protein VKQ32_03355 [Polyangia bacterium]|nr:hypothetical protein [Polyangia bacterium]
MRIFPSRTWFLLPLLAAPLGACHNDPIDPAQLADLVAAHAREVVHQSGGGVGFTQDSNSGLSKITTGASNATSGVMGAMPSPVPPAMASAMNDSPLAAAMAGMDSMLTTEEQFDETADRLKTWLRERVLADANLESKTDDEAIYLLHPDPTCRRLLTADDPPGTVPDLNATCVDQLTRLQVRVSLRADGDGGRLGILIGPDRIELSVFIIHSDLIALEMDLPNAYQATQVIDQTLGSSSPSPARFDALAGKIRLAIHKDGEKKVTFSGSVLDAIHIGTIDSAGGVGPDVKLGASDPTIAVTADGTVQALTVKVDMGALDVLGDWDPMGVASPNRDLHVQVGGVYGQATFTEASDDIVATNVGIGATTIDAHGARIFDLGLNPNDMRRFDARVFLNAAGQPEVQLTPRFDLDLGFHLGVVASEYTTPPPSYVLDETYRVLLDNGGATTSVAAVPASSTFGGGVKVTAGTLTISSTAAAQPVVVPTGKCLTGGATVPAGAHPVLGAFSVVDCN